MKDCLMLSLKTEESDQIEQIEELNEMLNKVGVSLELEDGGKGDGRYHLFKIYYDPVILYTKTNRNAGAPKKDLNKPITLIEIKEMIKEKTAEEVAKDLGISRSTLFRKIKQTEKLNLNYIF